MAAHPNHGGLWTDQIWNNIDASVKKTAMDLRVVQKVVPATQLSNVMSVPADVFDPQQMTITEGLMVPYIELAVRFSLTNGQVNGDEKGQTALTLATLAARSLALAEDGIFLQGNNYIVAPPIVIESGTAGLGLIDLPTPPPIPVRQSPAGNPPTNSGSEVLSAVMDGIANLTAELQAPPFGLFLDTIAYGKTGGSVINGTPTLKVLNQIITGGIYGTGALPRDTGLLAALGGQPLMVYFSEDPLTELVSRADTGKFLFRIFERVQLIPRDRRAVVRLDFHEFP